MNRLAFSSHAASHRFESPFGFSLDLIWFPVVSQACLCR
jgi:hypothetical protein